MDPFKMYFLLKMMIFHCYVCLPEGTWDTSSKMLGYSGGANKLETKKAAEKSGEP